MIFSLTCSMHSCLGNGLHFVTCQIFIWAHGLARAHTQDTCAEFFSTAQAALFKSEPDALNVSLYQLCWRKKIDLGFCPEAQAQFTVREENTWSLLVYVEHQMCGVCVCVSLFVISEDPAGEVRDDDDDVAVSDWWIEALGLWSDKIKQCSCSSKFRMLL